ncbi:uncharacterized protein BDV14DRAFT_197437 [Aspergillus stella-maris]|uniref:uncharacterized protein n=1 Tax=Aspergillus stella-maris TaxID=1810926 RepID=UPI003CCC9494
MKSFAAISTILAAASTARAQFGDAHVLKLEPLSVKTLTESQTARIDFTVQDLTGGAYTTCSTAWTIGALDSTIWFPCTDSSFAFTFPTGIDDVEDFDVLISHSAPEPVGSVIARAILNSHAGTPVYVCKTPGETPGTQTEGAIVEGSDVIAQPVNQ